MVEGNCFAFVGSSREAVSFAGPAAEKIDCAGELVLPGFVDGHVHVVMTRASPSDPSLPAHRPEWALPLEEAILHGTRESAYAAWLDHVTGAIKVGLAADMVVLDRDVFAEGPKALLETSIRLTMMDGRVSCLKRAFV